MTKNTEAEVAVERPWQTLRRLCTPATSWFDEKGWQQRVDILARALATEAPYGRVHTDGSRSGGQPPAEAPARADGGEVERVFTPERIAWASAETERLTRELDITNADHIALWLEANKDDSPLGWLACRIVEAHEHALSVFAGNPPKHVFWGAGEPDCPKDIKASNGELHTLRCKNCGEENLRNPICRAALATLRADGQGERL